YSLPMLFNKVWNNMKAAAEAYRLTGAGEIYNATSRVEGEEAAFYQAFADKLKAVKGSKDPDTQLLAGLYAELIRHPKGADPQAHFESSKRAIEESIRRLSVSEKHSQMAQDVERLYNQYFADTKNIQEATAKIKGTPAAEMAKFIRDRFQKHINDRLRENTERLHNEPYIEEENYSPRKHIFVDPEVSEEGHRMSSALPGKPRQSGTSMRAVNVLPNGAAINFELYHVAFQAYREAMHDIEASRHKMRFREFMKLPGSSEALGGVDNKRAIIRYYNKAESVARSLGKDYNDATRLVEEVTSSLRTLGYSAALGSVDQFAKQYAPVALNTAMNLGGDFGLFFSHINKPGEATPLLEMYTIGQRGKRLGGVERGESTRYKIQSKYRSKILKAVGRVHKLSDKMASVMMVSLQKGDVSVAERSWVAYYLKSLKDQGVDLKT